MIGRLVVALVLAAGAAAADPPLRPVARPEADAPVRPAPRPQAVLAKAVPRGFVRAEAGIAPPRLDLQVGEAHLLAPPRTERIARAAVQPMAKAPDRPPPRPHMPWMDVVQDPGALLQAEPKLDDPGFTEFAVAAAFRPPERPPEVTAEAERAKAERARGQVCSTSELQGDVLGTVDGPGTCGIENAVRVRSVGGVRLSTPATMDCTTARSLLAWVQTGALPAVGGRGGGLTGLRVASHYACRGRNNVAGARLSEHSFGRAIDIAAFQLRDGSEISVLSGWGSGEGDRLRRMWRAACGPFGTVLGPNANAYHRDHFHFDTARYRAGSYCR